MRKWGSPLLLLVGGGIGWYGHFREQLIALREIGYANPDVLALLPLGMCQKESIKSMHVEAYTRMLIALMLGMWGIERIMAGFFFFL